MTPEAREEAPVHLPLSSGACSWRQVVQAAVSVQEVGNPGCMHGCRPANAPQQPAPQTQAPLQRKGSLFVANEKGEMVPADDYLEELARQNPNWRQ